MKAILIDPSTKTVMDAEWDGVHKSIAPLIGCEWYCTVRLASDLMLLVDDNGLLTNPNPHGYFRIGNYPQVLAGKGLLIGLQPDGSDADAPCSAAFIERYIRFIDNPEPAEIEPKITVTSW